MSDSRKEELKQWKDERINSLRTPESSSVNANRDDEEKENSLPDRTPKQNALTIAIKEHENLKSKLLYVTKENTILLKEMSKLKEKQMQLEDNLREISTMEKLDTKEKDAEYVEIATNSQRQLEEITRLKMDVQRLKSKCGHISKDSMLCSV